MVYQSQVFYTQADNTIQLSDVGCGLSRHAVVRELITFKTVIGALNRTLRVFLLHLLTRP
jgi:hypothetical protein